MSKQALENKIADMKSISSDVDYLRNEISGKLHSKKGFDGEVDIVTMLEFALEYDYLLEHIVIVARKIKGLQ
tara:strand:+ start:41 stop:256 length:216 start_codon:yes stop_codon:yes gene_type:complete